ncbi:MAG TPA: PrsW family glutamic-type intramembrane protease [Candidatus Binatia bacterium]|nr:PrsW family glutamic-type intramembrane protease [Candidatus Binatia bacterium]
MLADLLLKALIAMAPVMILLLVFDRLDVFNLIPMRDIALLTITGVALALFSYFANLSVMDGFPIGRTSYSRYVAPVVEETMKAAPIIFLFSRNRLGFKLDAAIAGFAVGAGFSMAENLWYLVALDQTNITDWLVRGFGTAIMHGAATALFAVISHEFSEKQAEGAATHYEFLPALFVPGLLVAMALHSVFNHFPAQPLIAMVLTLLLAPMTLFLTLARSERATRRWLAADAAAHRQVLDDIRAGRFAESKTGGALRGQIGELRGVSPEDVMAYVELKMELVLRAEELILATHEGAGAAANDADREKFARLDALEHRLGKTVVAAISSRVGFSRNDLYELGRLRARLVEDKN